MKKNEIGKGDLLRKIKENLNALINEVSSEMLEKIGLGLEEELELDADEQTYFKMRDKERIEELAEAKSKKNMDLEESLWKLGCIAELQQNSELARYIEEGYESMEILDRAIENACIFFGVYEDDKTELIERVNKFLERETTGIEIIEARAATLENMINDFEQSLLER